LSQNQNHYGKDPFWASYVKNKNKNMFLSQSI